MRILFILLFLLSSAASAEVYKRVNPDGSVEFTDVPSKQAEEPVKLSPLSTFKAPPVAMPPASPPQTDVPYTYTELSITAPANDEAIRANAGNLQVSVSLTPTLHPDHSLVLLLDGKAVAKSASGSFALSNVDRGTHTLGAQVVDKEGKVQISATPVIFHLLRYSIR